MPLTKIEKKAAAAVAGIEKHWGLKQIGDHLGVNRMTIRRLVDSGHLQAVCVGGRIVVPESSIKRYLERNRLRTDWNSEK